MPDLRDVSREKQVRLARECLQKILGEQAPDLTETVDDEDNLVWTGVCPGGQRMYTFIAHLDTDEDFPACGDFGDIELAVEMDNRVGYFKLVHEVDEPEPYHARVVDELWVSEADASVRQAAVDLVGRLGSAFAERVRNYLSCFEQYSVEARHSSLSVGMIAGMDWDEEDWIDWHFDLGAELDSLDELAKMVEANLPDTFTTCGHCNGRMNAAKHDACPHCGAPL